jgi:hypothetical protein
VGEKDELLVFVCVSFDLLVVCVLLVDDVSVRLCVNVFVLVMVSIWARWFRVEDEAIRFAATWQYVAPQTQTNPARLGEVRLDFVDYPGHFVGCYCPELVDYLRQWPEPQVPVAYQVRWRGQRVENAYVTGIGNFPHPFKLTLHSGANGTLAQGPIESLRRR